MNDELNDVVPELPGEPIPLPDSHLPPSEPLPHEEPVQLPPGLTFPEPTG
jgi:hypothetical protein